MKGGFIDINTRGFDTTMKQIASLPQEVEDITEEEARNALEQFVRIATTPPGYAGQQNRAPFWVRGVGRRTGKMTGGIDQQSSRYSGNPGVWSIRVVGNGAGGVDASASTDVPYAKYLVSTTEQSRSMAQKGWRTAEAILNELGFSENSSQGFANRLAIRLLALVRSM